MNHDACILPLEDRAAQDRWQALWATSPQRSVFTSAGYARAVRAALGLEVEMHLVARRGRDEAGALVFVRRRGPYRLVALPPFTPYTSFVLRAPPPEADLHARRSALEALLAALEARYAALRFHLHPALPDVRVAGWRGWQARPLYTYRMPLVPAAQRFDAWSGSARRLVQNHAPDYTVAEAPDAADTVVGLAADAYGRHRRGFPAPEAAATALVHHLGRTLTAGGVRIFTAVANASGTAEAGLVVLRDAEAAAYWIAGSRPGPAMTVLLGAALPRLYEDGVRTLDFVGANTPSIAEFKRKFGPTLVPYYRIEKVGPAALRLLYRLRP